MAHNSRQRDQLAVRARPAVSGLRIDVVRQWAQGGKEILGRNGGPSSEITATGSARWFPTTTIYSR